MRAEDLSQRELLELDPEGGRIRFAGRRTLLLDVMGAGAFRKGLVGALGVDGARRLITRSAFAQGWRLAGAAEVELALEGEVERRRAGARLLAQAGLFKVATGDVFDEGGLVVESSFEAEEHLVHLGPSDIPVCWAACGLLSGYLSRAGGARTLVLEDRCVGRGDADCRFRARAAAERGAEQADALSAFEGAGPGEEPEPSPVGGAARPEQARPAPGIRRSSARAPPELAPPSSMIARSESMRRVVELARRVAKVDSTVLIIGESGVGKERIARLIHEESARAAGPMVSINCGAVTETLLESELFGHARGAFTGAAQDRPGLFEAAHGGTLLLDEVGEISPGMQVKLLRVLQEREVRRVGENRSRPVDVRVVAATNRDLSREVARANFRQDLYYRLRVVELSVPPLRDRREDILPIARALLAGAATRMASPVTTLSPAAADRLLRYAWPGNVRELENAMERAVALARGRRVEVDDLPEDVRRLEGTPAPVARSAGRPLDEVEREHILAVLAENGGNQTRAAEQLGIGTATLYRKLKRYGALARTPRGRGR